MPRKLRLFNGCGDHGYNKLDGHLYVCAASKAEAVRLLIQAGHKLMTIRELNEYWSKDAWGVSMKSIAPEIGVWFVPKEHEWDQNFTPKRLL